MPITIDVLANDNDPDGILNVATVSVIDPPINGSAMTNTDGTITYTPDMGSIGSDDFTYTVEDNSGAVSNLATVTVSITSDIETFQQASGVDGLVVIEAEDFDAHVARGAHSWVAVTPAGASGSALQAEPNVNTNNDTGYVSTSPRLDYPINFIQTGTHYVWVRGRGASSSDDSVHVGLNGVALSSADRIESRGWLPAWSWTSDTRDGLAATITVDSPGIHTLNVWMREDGFELDKLVLTTSNSYSPTDDGPPESSLGIDADQEPPAEESARDTGPIPDNEQVTDAEPSAPGNDVSPTLSVFGTSVTEGHTGTSAATFWVALSEPSPRDVVVSYYTIDGTATRGEDFVFSQGTLTLPAGQIEGTIAVPVLGDSLVEPEETFELILENASNAIVSTGSAIGFIEDDDAPTSVILEWKSPSTEPSGSCAEEVAGYRIHAGMTSGNYTRIEEVNLSSSDLTCEEMSFDASCSLQMQSCTYTMHGLTPGIWYFSVQAYDLAMNNSPYSEEVSGTIQ
jgi:hypothetical protein